MVRIRLRRSTPEQTFQTYKLMLYAWMWASPIILSIGTLMMTLSVGDFPVGLGFAIFGGVGLGLLAIKTIVDIRKYGVADTKFLNVYWIIVISVFGLLAITLGIIMSKIEPSVENEDLFFFLVCLIPGSIYQIPAIIRILHFIGTKTISRKSSTQVLVKSKTGVTPAQAKDFVESEEETEIIKVKLKGNQKLCRNCRKINYVGASYCVECGKVI